MALAEQARLGVAFARSLIAYELDGVPRPFSAALAVTDRCNLRCEYCNFPMLAKRQELSLEQLTVLLERLRRAGIQRLGLVGGEPMARKDLAGILKAARALGFFISVNTNLTLYHRTPGILDPADLVFTSLDGDPETHVASRGAKSLDGVWDAIDDLVARGKNVVAICVVRAGDSGEARRLLERASRHAIRVHFQPQCLDTTVVRGTLPDHASQEKLSAFWPALARMKNDGLPVASSREYLKAQAAWPDFRVSAERVAGRQCAAGRGFIFIDPQGNAFPCAYTRDRTPPVNLLENDWAKAWDRKTPCTSCNVGPMLEFNLLYERPASAVREAVRTYVS